MHTVTKGMRPMNPRHLLALAGALLLAMITAPLSADPPFQMTAGGMQYKTLLEGQGTPAAEGQIVSVHFVAWLDEAGQKGKELFNTRRDKGVVSYVLGTDKMMPAFNDGVIGMKPGGRRLLRAPPVFAWGERGVEGAVPPDSSVILLIDLVSVESQ